MATPSADDLLVERLPHFGLDERGLYYLGPTLHRLEVGAEHLAVLALCDGTRTARAVSRAVPGGRAALRALLATGVVVAYPPRRPGRSRWLVLSPHCDDAALSVGGLLAARRDQIDLTIFTVCVRSTWSTLEEIAGDEERVSSLRLAEERLYARLVGANLVALGLPERPLRGVEAGAHDRAFARALRRPLRDALAAVRPEVILCPMAVGDNTDHRAVRDALFALRSEAPARRSLGRVLLYEDLPYARYDYQSLLDALRRLRASGLTLRPVWVDITRTLPAKLAALRVYRSQEMAEWPSMMSEYARMCGVEVRPAGPPRERLWQLVG